MTTNTEIAPVPPKETAMAVFSAPQGLDPYLAKIREEIDGFIPDVTTRKGREAIASIAYKVAKSKTALDNVGKELVAELKDIPKKIDAERKRMRDTLDAWKDEVRKPLDEWEATEAARVAKLQNGIDWFNLRANENADLDATELKATIAEVERITVGEKWEEFEAEAHRAKAAALESLKAQLAKREKYESEQAELERLRKEAAARAEQDRIDAAARQAVEDERQRVAKQQQEQRDADDQRIKDADERATNAENERIAADQRVEDERKQSDQRVEQARLDEQQRQADEQAEQQRQTQARQADVEHKSKVLKAAKEAFVSMNISEDLAKAIVLKIARGEVPNVTISF